ncbi:hypothetical protein K8Q98_00660 [Candidatus Nomurabacteria bacterium]|nr:hypothetical protein [Candidatus Nomurabacteria bacterium]
MPGDRWPLSEPDFDERQLEKDLAVGVEDRFLTSELISFVKEGNTGRYIVGPDFEVVLSLDAHKSIFDRTHLDRKHSFITNGSFKIDPTTHKVIFSYNYMSMRERRVIQVRDASERKIKDFLRSHGIEIKD